MHHFNQLVSLSKILYHPTQIKK